MQDPVSIPMKYFFLLSTGLSFIAAVLGFGVLAGSTAAVFKFIFFGLFIAAMVMMFWPRKTVKPAPSSFAASFPSEPERVSKQAS